MALFSKRLFDYGGYANRQQAHHDTICGNFGGGNSSFSTYTLNYPDNIRWPCTDHFETSAQAYYLILAISPGCRIVFATAIILLIVPCLYLIFEDIKQVMATAPSNEGYLTAIPGVVQYEYPCVLIAKRISIKALPKKDENFHVIFLIV